MKKATDSWVSYCGYEMVVVEHEHDTLGQLGDLVYERGKGYSDQLLPHGARTHRNLGSKVLLFRHNPAQRLYYVPPRPDRIVILLVEGDPRERQFVVFCSAPVGQDRRLPVAGRGAYHANPALLGVVKELEQPATDQLLGTRRRRPQLGFEDNPGSTSASVARGVNDDLLRPAPLPGPRTAAVR